MIRSPKRFLSRLFIFPRIWSVYFRRAVLAVTKRKVSGGSRSMKRFEETANLLSVIQTCRFQARSVMAFFREAISAHSCDLAMPELIPILQT